MTLDSLRDFKWNASNCVPINSNIRDPRTARSMDRPVLIGPRFSKFCWSWSGQVPGFEIFLDPGPVPGFEIFLSPGPVGFRPWIPV